MLHKWKFIISNWINCYFNDTKTEECITVNTLLTIISHLHKNLNLDESKSSILEAQNIEEFILEKYPDFKFGNGSLEPANEEELYAIASLLLLFVCVNSKDVDIKQAMCSRLSPEDQETIMKFSKNLMECSPITYGDVQAAIIEACGPENASCERGPSVTSVAETPPALRSLHGEVRRLQAALDAERFDRNYLQEELSRTNLRMEKLQKDKEQYKLEILNLKARISMCCGQEAEARGTEAANENMARLAKQLQETEEMLVDTQGKLDDAQDERDAYKAKIEELKQERDKWLNVSQEETTRAGRLADELDAERRRVQSLQELVSELRQHHQNNRLDASSLECDDPDASIHSLHNASVCSEACANVIEVQLVEEKAKVEALQHEIQCLQEQLTELTQRAESEKLSLENIISGKDSDISDLKHRINEEVQARTNLTAHFNDEVSKLSNDINELEHKIKENCENSRATINQKMAEIETLQEEKLSLLQSLTNETNKLENIIKGLKEEIDTEKNVKVRMREDYENQLMKLNEKVLNRNNELVELQNKVFEKGEMMEKLNLELKKEKELNHEVSNKHNDEIAKFNAEKNELEQKLQQKSEEARELQRRLFQNVAVFDELNREIDDLKSANNNILENYKVLEEMKDSLQGEVQQRDSDIDGIRKEIENITNIFSEEKDKFMRNLEERNVVITALQVRLQDEIQYKIDLEKELQTLHQARVQLNEEVMKLSKDLSSSKADISEKDRMIYALELYLKEERHANIALKSNNDKLNEDIVKLSDELSAKTNAVKVFEETMEHNNLRFEEELRMKDEILESTNNKLFNEMEEKEALQMLLMAVNEEKEIINKDLIDRCNELEKMQEDYERLCSANEEYMKEHEDISVNIASVVNSGLDKLLQNIDKENIQNEVLQKLITVDKADIPLGEKCELLVSIADTLSTELAVKRKMAMEHENSAVTELQVMIKEKEMQALELHNEVKRLQKEVQDSQTELENQTKTLNMILDAKVKDIQSLQIENKSLNNELNDVKVQLNVKVHSLKEKLIDNENLTDKLKRTYECQIENLNVMVTKLTSYLKEKTYELDGVRKEKEKLQQTIDDNNKAIKSLEDEIKVQTANQEKLITDFESERQVIKNMVTVTESIMEDQKVGHSKVITDYEKTIESYQNEKKTLEELVKSAEKKAEDLVQEKQNAFDAVFKELTELRKEKEVVIKDLESNIETLNKEIASLKEDLLVQKSATELLEVQNKALEKEREQMESDMKTEKDKIHKEIELLEGEVTEKVAMIESLQAYNTKTTVVVSKLKDELLSLQGKDAELKIKKDSLESELLNRIEKITKALSTDTFKNNKLKYDLLEKLQAKTTVEEKMKILSDEVVDLVKEKNDYISKWDEAKAEFETKQTEAKQEIEKWKEENSRLSNYIEENKTVITKLEEQIKSQLEQLNEVRKHSDQERLNYENRCALLQEYQTKAEKHIQEREKEIASLKSRIKSDANFDQTIENLKEQIADKDALIAQIAQVKDEVIGTLNKELIDEKESREKYQQEFEMKTDEVKELKAKLDEAKAELATIDALKKDNAELLKVVGQRETFAVTSQERMSSNRLTEKELRDRDQVSTPTSDLTHSSMESYKTITDLEKIIHDKNRTITTLQSDITYMKSLMADSENKLLDVTKELEISKETCDQLSSQLKKLVHQKNEEIADLKKQVSKMSVTENRATQIIKVSAKYQAIILKRIAEIKSNTILKELTNFGNTANCDSDLKRNINSGAITMEDLENFLETTDKHLRRCSEKQQLLQKERDRLSEINRINDSEIINLKKFLTELSVSFKTFNSIKDLYTQKLSRVVSMQRTVRREILNLDGQITDSMMGKLERGYAAVMQDLCECTMTLERWVERSIARTISSEKIKQAFTSDTERVSLASTTFQNASLEVQLEELENSFQKLLEEVVRAPKGEGAKDAQAVTVMEVRAEYEDKLNRMKAKMKQLYQDQIQVFKTKQKEEIAHLEQELQKTKEKLAESSRAYEEHIKALTTELWNVGEKFLMKKDEAEWLRKRQKSGSLISLQHLHSTGLSNNHERIPESPSNSQSLQSLPANCGMVREAREARDRKKRDGRGLHMSDEEGEVFDNRWLKELHTPRRESNAGQRLSELRWRNSLCPPHLKSSYPAETQFANTLDEEDIKCVGAASLGSRPQRKEVGITAYKKPGPPTPSKQAGRLSATDSELRESLRVEAEPAPSRKTSTPSRIRALFRTGRSDTVDLPESEYPKCETSAYPKDSERTDTDCVSDRKCDWFNLSLRQRAARWEPLAKD